MEFEKTCDFCLILRAIVYCKADAAHLCLPCDARVHSANKLSSRHPRSLVCEACRCRAACVRCDDHHMFMCRGCSISQHHLSSQHKRKLISSFMGCPSAGDFAALWWLDLNRLEDRSLFREEFLANFSRSCSKSGSSSVSGGTSTGVITLPNAQYLKAPDPQDNEGQILQQIHYLKLLQLNQGSGDSSLVRSGEEVDVSSFKHNAKQMPHQNLDQQLQHSLDLDSDLHSLGSPYEEPISEPFPMVLPQMEGESFWQCKSPLQSRQLWTQNMQDLGVCDDPGSLEDFSMPDVDPTFKNLEEIFGGEQELDRALLEEDAACSSREKEMSVDKSDKGYERSVEDVSAASSAYLSYSANVEKGVDSSDNVSQISQTKDCPPTSEFLDSGQLSDQMKHNPFYSSTDPENSNVDTKRSALLRFKEKKKSRMSEKQTRYINRKSRSEVKKPVRGIQFTRGGARKNSWRGLICKGKKIANFSLYRRGLKKKV